VRKTAHVEFRSPRLLVGRARERAAIAALVEAPGGVLVVGGEPGIGKSRLLGELGLRAEAAGATVLAARASEFEGDLPYALWTEALDAHLAAAGERRLSRLGLADAEALVAVLPAVGALAGRPSGTDADRHRIHRALRDLLSALAAVRQLVVCLDDVHWADPPSVEALAALVRRPPDGRVLVALAARTGRLPAAVDAALGDAARDDRLLALDLEPLSEAEAAELVGDRRIYARAGGNPFYLEQLARAGGAPGPRLVSDDDVPVAGGAGGALGPRLVSDDDVPAAGGAGGALGRRLVSDEDVPAPVAAALAAELAELEPEARRLLDAAAVAGDPFDPGLAAAVAELPEPEALRALDRLLLHALVRPAGAPRRFAFRHPVVRHAVYVAAPGGWRLGAHARASDALERQGAGPVQRAHHVEQSAAPGDADAVSLLTVAAEELRPLAPAAAARWYAAALRLLPDTADRVGLRARLADAQAAGGDPLGARTTLLDALRAAGPADRLALTVALANQEWRLGANDDARRRLHVALGDLPAEPSPDRIRLRLALGLTALMDCDLVGAQGHCSDARDDSRAIGDPVTELAALACLALACAAAADPAAADALDASAAALERLTPAQLATRLPALWMQGRARRCLGRFEAALADLRRGAAIAADTGRETVLLVMTIESVAPLIELGLIADAVAAAEDGAELARLAGNPRTLLWAHSALAESRLAAGEVAAALRHAEKATALGTEADFHAAGQPGWCLGTALTAAGNADTAVATLLEAFGGSELPRVLPADRPAAAADLVEAYLACGDVAAAQAALAFAAPSAVTELARATVLQAAGRAEEAVRAATAARDGAVGAPLLAARAELVLGRALALAGQRPAAIEALATAEAAFDRFGARRRRDEAVRELRRLGRRVVRAAGEPGDGALTAREREIAALVAAGRTNREVAEQLVLSPRTIDAHLRSIYGKLGVRSRVELAGAMQRAARA
jgi:DNA-binding CsgD family transcriptional regulator